MESLKATNGTEEALSLMFDSLSAIEDPATKAALANAAFGRSGLKMGNLVKDGVQAILDLRNTYKSLGGGFNEQEARNAEKFTDRYESLTTQIGNFKNVLGAQFFPVLIPFFDKLSGLLATLPVREFGQKLASMVPTIEQLTLALKATGEVIQGVANIFKPFMNVFLGGFNILASLLGGKVNAAIVLITSAISVGLAGALKAIIPLLARTTLFFITNPIGQAIIALSAIVALIKLVIDHMPEIIAYMQKVGDMIKDFFGGLPERIEDTANKVQSFLGKFPKAIGIQAGFDTSALGSVQNSLSGFSPQLVRESITAPTTTFSNQKANLGLTIDLVRDSITVNDSDVEGFEFDKSNVKLGTILQESK